MARQRKAVQHNNLIGGINSDSNPLTFPENSLIQDLNFDIEKDGTRKRRLGFDMEYAGTIINTGITRDSTKKPAYSEFIWENPNNNPKEKILVVQYAYKIFFFRITSYTISTSLISTITLPTSIYDVVIDFTNIGEYLIITYKNTNIQILTYNGTTISSEIVPLYVRDFWGVYAENSSGLSFVEPSTITFRPAVLVSTHLYNLRNQTFALPKVEGDADTTNVVDCIAKFYAASGSTKYPSNADSVLRHVLSDPNLASNRTVERFKNVDMFKTPPPNTQAPKGYFIIDFMNRGASRRAGVASLETQNPALTLTVNPSNILDDVDTKGATTCETYAGRVWFAGFERSLTNGDSLSPNINTYVLFSQIVKNKKDINRCYQIGDPTSDDPDLVDTDGGYIVLSGVSTIYSLVALSNFLYVFTDKGIWKISGQDNNMFNATSFSVEKLSNISVVGKNSIVSTNDKIFFLSYEGIHAIVTNDVGDISVEDLSFKVFQNRYNEFFDEEKQLSTGWFNSSDNEIRWIFAAYETGIMREIVYHIKYNIFTENYVESDPTFSAGVRPVCCVDSEKLYKTSVKGNKWVTPKESLYIINCGYILNGIPNTTLKFAIGGYGSNIDLVNGTSVEDYHSQTIAANLNKDNTAILQTGPINLGDNRLRKEVPYLSTYFYRTNASGTQLNSSSQCNLEVIYDWDSKANSGNIYSAGNIYRPSIVIPLNLSSFPHVVTKTKIRGSGSTVSFKFYSSPQKYLHIQGWEFNLQAGSEE